MDVGTLLIPVFAAVIGYATNWLAVKMMFQPLQFVGVGPVGWQGVIPSKAAKMGSISVDKGIAKLGSVEEFYRRLDPERLAQHVVANSQEDLRVLTDRVIVRRHPQLWRDLPDEVREAVHGRVAAEFPRHVQEVTDDIGRGIEHLMDLKLMVVRHLDEHPELVNRIFQDVGHKEFRFIINSGAWLGFMLGLIQMGVWIVFPQWWIIPLAGMLVGWATNFIALRIIFHPVHTRRVGPFKLRGLFLRRQPEVADVYSRIVTDEILTMRNMTHEMLHGPSSDRTRQLIEARLEPAVDEAVGAARPAVRALLGPRDYDAIQEGLAEDAVDFTMEPLEDEQFNRERAEVLHGLLSDRMRELPAPDFAEMLRSSFREDEWRLIAVGAALGSLAGVAQLLTTLS